MCYEIERLDKTIRIINGVRYYEMPLSINNKANAEKTMPIAIKINDKVIKASSWSDLFYNSVLYLITFCKCNYRYHVFNNLTLNNMPLFIKVPHVGYKRLKNNIYIKCNAEENMLYILLVEILGYFEYKNNPHLLVYRYPISENKYVKEYILNKNKSEYNLFLKGLYSPLLVIEIERKIKVVDEVFSRFSSFVSLFLFDSYIIFMSEIKSFFESINGLYSPNHLLLFKENVTKYLIPYYKQVNLY